MVQAENGTIVLKGASGREYSLSFYASDVAAAYCTLSLNGIAVAGSTNFYIIPENCQIKDISLTTGLTATTMLIPQVNDVNVGSVISCANIINTLTTRSFPALKISGGRKFTLVQA